MADPTTELHEPASTGSERDMLLAFLDYFRGVFIRKVEGISDEQARLTVPPSPMDLLGMTRHLADVERWWFRASFAAEVTEGIYDSDDDPDLDWHHGPGDTLAEAVGHWYAEVARAREIVAATHDLDTAGATVHPRRGPVTLRWILIHMVEEYARHCGHADYLREAIDGRTGD
jgi:hypothetical protein